MPLAEVASRLHGDAELAAVLVAEASETLRPADPAHLALLQTQTELRDRLATRHRELTQVLAGLEVSLALAAVGLP